MLRLVCRSEFGSVGGHHNIRVRHNPNNIIIVSPDNASGARSIKLFARNYRNAGLLVPRIILCASLRSAPI